jgi:hypothetical protein
VPPLTTLHVWGVPGRAVPAALLRMAADRRPLRRTPGLRFGKLLGTGSGRTFTVRDADPRRWALLAVWDDDAAADAFEGSPVLRRWRRLAAEEFTARLRPLAARGQWSGQEPFGSPTPQRWDGLVAAITRARLVPRTAVRFWVWASAAALNDFAYGRAAHAAVVDRTAREGWYAEELFARFAVLSAAGTIGGRSA